MAENPITNTEDSLLNKNERKAVAKQARRRLLWLGLLILLVVLGYVFFTQRGENEDNRSGRGGDARKRPQPISAVPATTKNVNVYLTALGTIVPKNTVTVRSRVDGQLMRVLFTEGQVVKAGQLLAEVDPRPFQVQLTQANGQLARDLALLRNAELDLQRYRDLLAQDSIAKQQVDTQEAQVRQYRGVVQADQGQVDNAKLQLSYTRIVAPITGRIGLRQVDPGNIIHAGDANGLTVITQVTPITALFSIPQDALSAVLTRTRAGSAMPVEAFGRDQKSKLANGMLLTVDNQIDPTTGTVRLKAQFPNNDESLFPNQFVSIRLLLNILENATVVPSAAIQQGTQGTFVYVVNNDQTVSMRPVKTGPVEAEVTTVDSGVKPNELVVVDGADKLRDGAKVELIKPGNNQAGQGNNNRGAKGERKRRRGGGE